MSDFSRQLVTVVELDLDRCDNVYGSAPCTAAGAVGSECYNAYPSCQDKINFARGIYTWSFCTPNALVPAGRTIRPYIQKLEETATEIDLDEGLAWRGRVTITLTDPADRDTEADPYHATRAAPAGGSFFTRLLARNKNYAGRFARVKTARFTDGWDDAQFTTHLYVIESIDPPDAQRRVRIVLKDATTLADWRTLPEATGGKLAGALAADGLSMTLGIGQGALYPATGHVRVGDEVIEYTANAGDVLAWPGLSYRGKFGTLATEHKDGDGVQLCHVWQNARLHQVLEDLLLAAGIPAANIDSAGFAAEDDAWLGTDFAVTTCISEPVKISALLKELLAQTGSYAWWDRDVQQVRFKAIAPTALDAPAIIELTEVAHIIEGTLRVERLDKARLTVAGIYYDLATAASDPGKALSYLRGEVWVDVDAESPNEYGDRRSDIQLSRWFTAANAIAMQVVVGRRTGRYRDAPQRISLALDGKDAGIKAGDLVDLSVSQIVGLDGQPATVRTIVTRRRDEGRRIALTLRATDLGARYGFWAPDATGDYPADPEYAHWAPDTETFPDGSGAYLYF